MENTKTPTKKNQVANPANEVIKPLQKDAPDQLQKILKQLINNLKKSVAEIGKLTAGEAEKFFNEVNDLEEQFNDSAINLFKDRTESQKKAIKIRDAFEQKLYKNSDVHERIRIRNNQAERIKSFRKEYENKELLQEALTEEIIKQSEELKEKQSKLQEELNAEERKNLLETIEAKSSELDNLKKDLVNVQEDINNAKEDYESSFEDLKFTLLDKADLAKADGATKDEKEEGAKALREAAQLIGTKEKEGKKLLKEANALEKQARGDEHREKVAEAKQRNADRIAELKYRLSTADGIKETIGQATEKLVGGLAKMFDNIESDVSTFFEYQAKYEARLEGTGNEYSKMMSNISKQVGLSPYVKQKELVKNLQDLIDKGIDYNVELRAYIATVSENIASTFDAFDSNLLRLIRIQQNDSTAARLGMESVLNEFLNKMYSDTSYLGSGGGSGLSDTVSAALVDASAQLTHVGAAEMEFSAQKWLGSLYSLGVSDQAIQNIATGLGYLGSGNVEELSSNQALMSLLAMSATKGGTSLTDILTNGLTASRTDKLLQGMVEYLAEIAKNTDNNVTKTSIAQIFGLTNTDLRSISNLTQEDINNIAATDLNYSQALIQASSDLKTISERMHLSQAISNVIENASVSSALKIGGNSGTYAMYKALNIVSSLVGDRGLEIPGIQAFGTGTASGIDILSVAKAGIAGAALLSSLVDSIGNIGSGGLPQFDRWSGYEKSLERGSAIDIENRYGVQSGFSENVVYSTKGNSSTSDMAAASMEQSESLSRENASEEDQGNKYAENYYRYGIEYLEDIDTSLKTLNSTTLKTELDKVINKIQEVKTDTSYLQAILEKIPTNEYVENIENNEYNNITNTIFNYQEISEIQADKDVLEDLEQRWNTFNEIHQRVAESPNQVVSLSLESDNPLPVNVVSNSGPVKVNIEQLSETLSNKLSSALRAIIMSAFADEMITNSGDPSISLVQQIVSALQGLNVHIGNDFFDESLQRTAFGGF